MKKTFAAVLAISMAILWAGGCQEEQVSSDVKQSRLIAAENGDLNRQLQQETKKRDDEIKNLKTEAKKRGDEIKNLKTQSQAEAKKRDNEIKKLSEQLKKAQLSIQAEITKRDDEIKGLVDEYQTGIKKRDGELQMTRKQLGECAQTRDERLAKEIDKECQDMVSKLLDWTAELLAENERLKAGQADVNKGDTDK
jgi:Skp family chaperone for outer membrane proteins